MSGLDTLLASQSAEGTKGTEGKKSSSSTISTPKEGASLFDSMLAQLNTKASGEVSLEGSEGESKTGLSKEGSAKQGEVKTQASGTAQKGAVSAAGVATQSTSNTTPSLFDKMVAQTNQQNTAVNPNAQTATQANSVPADASAIKQNSVQTSSTTPTQTLNTQVTAQQSANTSSQNLNTKVDINLSPVPSDMKSDNISKAQNTSTYTTAPQEIDDAALDTLESKNTLGDTKEGVKQTQNSTSSQISQTSKAEQTKVGSLAKNIDTTTSLKEQTVQVKDKTATQNLNGSLQNKGKNVDQGSLATPNKTGTDTKQTSLSPNETALKTVDHKTVNSKDGVVDNKQGTKATAAVGAENLETTKNAQSVNVENRAVKSINTTGQTPDQVKTDKSVQTAQSNIQNQDSLVTKNPLQTDNLQNPSAKTVSTNTNKTNSTQTIVKNSNSAELNTNNIDDGSNDQNKRTSLADKLISTAAATALVDKATSDKSVQNGTKDLVGKQTAELNTQAPSSNGLTQTISLSGVDTISSDSENPIDNPIEKIDIKNIEQNIIDKKIDNKTLDTKQALDKHQLIQGEKDHLDKVTLASGATATALSSSDSSTAGSTISNQELASQLATIRDTAKEGVATVSSNEVKTALKQDNKENTQENKKQLSGNNLLDKMMQEAQSSTDNTDSIDDGTLGTKDQFVQKDLPLFATSAYLNDQKKRNEIANMIKKSEGVQEALNAKNVSDIKKSADTLGLNAGETQVIEEAVQKEESRAHNNREDMLKRLAFDNNVGKKLHNNNQQLRTNETIVAQAASLTDKTEEKVVEVAVSNEAAQTIENRIIGARQTLRSMMSDIARQMAQNYRPPLTAFRINLNPAGLGNIAVMLKGEQSKGITISLNMSNSNTLDTMVDNQAALRAALTRNFETATNFELNFGMQQDNNSNQNQNNEQSNQNGSSSNGVVQANNMTNQEVEEVTEQVNYM